MRGRLDTESKKCLSDVVLDQKPEVRQLAIQISVGRTFQAEGMVGAMTLKQVHVLVGHSGVLWDIVRTLGFTL